jgi:hypothetical protein
MKSNTTAGRLTMFSFPGSVAAIFFTFCGTGAMGQAALVDSEQSIRKGKTFVGTYFNFSIANTTKNKVAGVDTNSDQIKLGGNVTGGKMLSDHWGVLLNLGYTETNTTTPLVVSGVAYNAKDKRSDYTIAAAVRYYKLISEDTYFFLQGGALLSKGTLDTDELDRSSVLQTYSYKTTGYGVGISPGFSYFMTDKLSTEISIGLLGYSVFNGKDEFGNTTQTTTFQSLLYLNSVSLGFVFYL